MHNYLSTLAGTLLAFNVLAEPQVARCQYPDGRVLFSQSPCPTGTIASRQPINVNSPLKLTQPAPAQPTARTSSVVRGIPQASACQTHLDPQQMRQALVRQQPQPGMSRAQVLSAFGKPLRVSHTKQGERFVYVLEKGRTRTLQFDDKGCLRR